MGTLRRHFVSVTGEACFVGSSAREILRVDRGFDDLLDINSDVTTSDMYSLGPGKVLMKLSWHPVVDDNVWTSYIDVVRIEGGRWIGQGRMVREVFARNCRLSELSEIEWNGVWRIASRPERIVLARVVAEYLHHNQGVRQRDLLWKIPQFVSKCARKKSACSELSRLID